MIRIMKKSTVDSLYNRIAILEEQVATQNTTTVTLTRIKQDVYEALASRLMKPTCPKTELEAAYSLGIQHVLEQIREGWVV